MSEDCATRLMAALLAAGGSTRLGRCKQLLTLNGEFLLVRAHRRLAGIAGLRVVTVLGAEAARIVRVCRGELDFVIVNDDWEDGLGSSLRSAIEAAPPAIDGLLVALADQVAVPASHYAALVDRWTRQPDALVVSAYSGSEGVPAILPAAMLPAVASLDGDRGASVLFSSWRGERVSVELEAGALDIDSGADFARLAIYLAPD